MMKRAHISDMNQTLGNMIGNALEIQESIDILGGKDLMISLTLS